MKFTVNIYFDPCTFLRDSRNWINVSNKVLERIDETDKIDLVNALCYNGEFKYDEDMIKAIENLPIEQLERYIFVHEDSIEYDKNETIECDNNLISYSVEVSFYYWTFMNDYESYVENDYSPSNPWDAPGMSVNDFVDFPVCY